MKVLSEIRASGREVQNFETQMVNGCKAVCDFALSYNNTTFRNNRCCRLVRIVGFTAPVYRVEPPFNLSSCNIFRKKEADDSSLFLPVNYACGVAIFYPSTA
ncbi:hypothetical protein AVEN_106308-1 [Araneus ventricosus]|uniref:Uncharacterized protein n=1 Tax=Araneus ventricosus TaxID=182803 RepID=A0A4Y2AUB4_ARAVE|nr:hypothetical protein AVEN_106308-1 [Araneus ventricosus]